MTFRFSLVLNREVTEQEMAVLKEASSADLSFAADSLPTDSAIAVTQVTFEDEAVPTLAAAIEAGFNTVKAIPDLAIPSLSVPAQPAVAQDADVVTEVES